MQGKVLSMTGIKQTEVQTYDLPSVEKGQVLMEVSKANICGSDLHMWEGKHVFKNHVLGHEMVGLVHTLGEGVVTDYAGEPIKEGDRICPVYYLTCQKCEACLDGNFNVCTHGSDYMGQLAKEYPHFTGAFATHYLIQPNQYFYKVPENIPDVVVAGANCGISQMYFAIDQIDMPPNALVVVQGAGGLGLFSTAISDSKGANVIVIDSVASRLEQSKKFGAKFTINMKEFKTAPERLNEILKFTNGKAPDIVIDVTGYPPALDEAVRMVKIGGTILEIGSVSVDEDQNVTLVPGYIVRKSLTIKGVLRYDPWYLYKTLQWLSKYYDKYDFINLTDKLYSLEEGQEALTKAYNREVTRAILDPTSSK